MPIRSDIRTTGAQPVIGVARATHGSELGWSTKVDTLRGLLHELGKREEVLYRAILIEIESGTRVASDTAEGTLRSATSRPLEYFERYGREYADCPFVLLGVNKFDEVGSLVTIGRSRRCDVRIDNDSVSKAHSTLEFKAAHSEYYLVDEFSRNGTYINDKELVPGLPTVVWPGAHVSFGDAVFVFMDPPTLRRLCSLAL